MSARTLAHRLLGKDPRDLWIRYVVAISALVILLSSIHVFEQFVLREKSDMAGIINESGLQRALTLKMLYKVKARQLDPDVVSAASLSETIGRFAASHEDIAAFARTLDATRFHYFAPEGPHLDRLSREFVDLAKRFQSFDPQSAEAGRIATSLEALGTGELFRELDRAVGLFESIANEQTNAAISFQNYALLTALVLLVLEGFLIFWPAHRAVKESFEELRSSHVEQQKKSAQLQDYARRLSDAAYTDPLTGLANRAKLYASLSKTLQSDDLATRKICVMQIDLDDFKLANDLNGHAVGDAVLREVADVLLAIDRRGTLAARMGGDEFVVVCEFRRTDSDDVAQALCEQIIADISKPRQIGHSDVKIGASIGYTFASPDNHDPDDLLKEADVALYAAKEQGKGTAARYSSSIRSRIRTREESYLRMIAALDNGEIVPFLQPITGIETGAIVGVEVLARWQHESHGILTASEFLPQASDAGLVEDIDARMILDGLDAVEQCHAAGWPDLSISLNASTALLRQEHCIERLERAVRARGHVPQRVILEVAASAIDADGDPLALANMLKLTEAGFRIHVDDFGPGYASIARMAKLRVSGLKIEPSLISDIAAERSEQVVSGIVAMARAMDMVTIAEGVEQPAQFATLKKLGVDRAQGFGIASPMPTTMFLDWLSEYGKGPKSRPAG